MFRKNVQNELRAVNYASFGHFFNVALLYGGQIRIEDTQRCLRCIGLRGNFFQLSATDEGGWISFVAQLEDSSGNIRTGAARQFDELQKRFPLGRPRGLPGKSRRTLPGNADKKRALRDRNLLACFHLEGGTDSVA